MMQQRSPNPVFTGDTSKGFDERETGESFDVTITERNVGDIKAMEVWKGHDCCWLNIQREIIYACNRGVNCLNHTVLKVFL